MPHHRPLPGAPKNPAQSEPRISAHQHERQARLDCVAEKNPVLISKWFSLTSEYPTQGKTRRQDGTSLLEHLYWALSVVMLTLPLDAGDIKQNA